jgi:hypothetical protein
VRLEGEAVRQSQRIPVIVNSLPAGNFATIFRVVALTEPRLMQIMPPLQKHAATAWYGLVRRGREFWRTPPGTILLSVEQRKKSVTIGPYRTCHGPG